MRSALTLTVLLVLTLGPAVGFAQENPPTRRTLHRRPRSDRKNRRRPSLRRRRHPARKS